MGKTKKLWHTWMSRVHSQGFKEEATGNKLRLQSKEYKGKWGQK